MLRTWFFALMIYVVTTSAQALNPGDIAFTMYNTDGDDTFAFVALVDIPAATEIKFTDKGWTGSEFDPSTTAERTITLTTTALAAGEEVLVNGLTFTRQSDAMSASQSVSIDDGISTKINLSGGDQIFAYQGLASSPTFIAGIHGDYNELDYDAGTGWNDGTSNSGVLGTARSLRPAGLSDANSISLYAPSGPELDNARFDCSTVSGGPNTVRAAIHDRANWVATDASAYTPDCTFAMPLPVDLQSFSVQ